MMPRISHVAVAALLLSTLSGCSASEGARARVDKNPELAARERWTEQFRREQSRVAWENQGLRTYGFADGTVTVRDFRLHGWQGNESLWVRYTYSNSTDRIFDRARVWVTLHSPDGLVVASRWQDLLPWIDFHHGDSYTNEISVPTHGVQAQPGWYWKVGCSATERRVVAQRAGE
jgi:hypothetical protein